MKKHIVINRQWIWFLLLISTFVALGILVLGDMDDIALGLLLLLLALGMLALLVWFMPLCFLFDREGVRICYTFGRYEEGKWAKIRRIWLEPDVDSPPCTYSYHFTDLTGNRRHTAGQIPKTRKITRLIHQYWPGAVIDERPPRFGGCKPNDLEAAAAENTARSRIKNLLKAYRPEFGNRGVLLSHRFCYAVGGEDGSVRPLKNYEFTVEIELKDEKAPEERVCYLADVPLAVRCTKERYLPFPQEAAYTRLLEELDWSLSLLIHEGRDALFKEPEEPDGLLDRLKQRLLMKIVDQAEKHRND